MNIKAKIKEIETTLRSTIKVILSGSWQRLIKQTGESDQNKTDSTNNIKNKNRDNSRSKQVYDIKSDKWTIVQENWTF